MKVKVILFPTARPSPSLLPRSVNEASKKRREDEDLPSLPSEKRRHARESLSNLCRKEVAGMFVEEDDSSVLQTLS